MYLSRAELHYRDLPLSMLTGLCKYREYAVHQWLWELFPDQRQRNFLFRQQETASGLLCHLLSDIQPAAHSLLRVSSKSFNLRLTPGERLYFSLRANPVITRGDKRSDVLMDAKYHAPKTLEPDEIWQLQQQAAADWLIRQGENSGFMPDAGRIAVTGYRQHWPKKRRQTEKEKEEEKAKKAQKHLKKRKKAEGEKTAEGQEKGNDVRSFTFRSVDLEGMLTVTEPDKFIAALLRGFGKSRAMGCGLMMLKRR